MRSIGKVSRTGARARRADSRPEVPPRAKGARGVVLGAKASAAFARSFPPCAKGGRHGGWWYMAGTWTTRISALFSIPHAGGENDAEAQQKSPRGELRFAPTRPNVLSSQARGALGVRYNHSRRRTRKNRDLGNSDRDASPKVAGTLRCAVRRRAQNACCRGGPKCKAGLRNSFLTTEHPERHSEKQDL